MRNRRIKSLLELEYMSSESSANETDSEQSSLKVRRLPFLKKKYSRVFHQIDTIALGQASKRGMHQRKKRVASKRLSKRPVPPSIPKWAVAEDLNSSQDQENAQEQEFVPITP